MFYFIVCIVNLSLSLLYILVIGMCRKKYSVYGVWYFLWFQLSTGVLESNLLGKVELLYNLWGGCVVVLFQ